MQKTPRLRSHYTGIRARRATGGGGGRNAAPPSPVLRPPPAATGGGGGNAALVVAVGRAAKRCCALGACVTAFPACCTASGNLRTPALTSCFSLRIITSRLKAGKCASSLSRVFQYASTACWRTTGAKFWRIKRKEGRE